MSALLAAALAIIFSFGPGRRVPTPQALSLL